MIAALVLGALGTTSCTDPAVTSPGKMPAAMTQRATGVTVSATNPSYGHQGQTGEHGLMPRSTSHRTHSSRSMTSQ